MLGFFKYYEDVKPEEGVEGAFMIMYNIKTAEELQLVASEMIARFFLDSKDLQDICRAFSKNCLDFL